MARARPLSLLLWLVGLVLLPTLSATAKGADEPLPSANLQLHAYRPDAHTLFAPVRPLAQWLNVELAVEPDGVLLTGHDTTVKLAAGQPRIIINGKSQSLERPIVEEGQLLVPLREVAEAFGATTVYNASHPLTERAGAWLRQGERRLWVPLFSQPPATMTARLAALDEVVPGTYGQQWLLRYYRAFGDYALVSVQSLQKEPVSPYFLLRRQNKKWQLLTTAKSGNEAAQMHLQQLMKQANPSAWRDAVRFLTSNPPPTALIVPDIPQVGLSSVLPLLHGHKAYFHFGNSALRLGGARETDEEKRRREQLAFYSWFLRTYSGRLDKQTLALAIYHRGMAAWALGDLEEATHFFRRLLNDYGEVTLHSRKIGSLLTQVHWVTLAAQTPVYRYDARETSPGPPVLLKQVRSEPRHTLLSAFSVEQIELLTSSREDYQFYKPRLKLGEGSLVISKEQCISLAEFSRRVGGR